MPFSEGKAILRFTFTATHETWGDRRRGTFYCHKVGTFGFMIEVSRAVDLGQEVEREIAFILSHLKFTPVK